METTLSKQLIAVVLVIIVFVDCWTIIFPLSGTQWHQRTEEENTRSSD